MWVFTGVSQRLCFCSGVVLICASGPQVFYFQQLACCDIFVVQGWLVLHAERLLQVCLCFNVLSCRGGERRTRKRKWERKSQRQIKLNTVHHRWLLFRIPGSWSHAALSLYLTDPVGYELIKRNTSLDIVSTLLSDYQLQPLSTEIGLLQQWAETLVIVVVASSDMEENTSPAKVQELIFYTL